MITVAHEALEELVTEMIGRAGSNPEEARTVARNLVEANLLGHDSHGIGLVGQYMRHAQTGTLTVNGHVSHVSDNGVYLLLDGNMAYGQVTGAEAMHLGLDRARTAGAAIVGLRNSHHLGRIGAWGEICAREGFISIHFVNVVGHRPIVAPWGGAEARYSTNPYCTAIPATDKNPMFVLDMATSRVALGKVRVAYNAGKEVVEGALIDHNGQPTRNAAVMYEEPNGALQAFGQHKGYGLALLGEILGAALLGGPVTDPAHQKRDTICNSMLTVIIDPKGFGRDIPFGDLIDSMLAYVTSARPAEGTDKVRVAGEPERETAAHRKANGIPVDPGTWSGLVEAGVNAGMDRHAFDGIAK
jgi:uncharacterized oxidoreductase